MLHLSNSAGLVRALGLSLAIFAVAVPASAAGNAAAGKTKAAACAACHGADGNGGADPSWPKLAGQHENYLSAQLLAFKSSRRASDGEIMTRIAFRMSEAEIKAVSEYMAGLH